MPPSEQYVMPNNRQNVSLSHVCPLSHVSVSLLSLSLSLQSLFHSSIESLTYMSIAFSLVSLPLFLSCLLLISLSFSCLSLPQVYCLLSHLSLSSLCLSFSFYPHTNARCLRWKWTDCWFFKTVLWPTNLKIKAIGPKLRLLDRKMIFFKRNDSFDTFLYSPAFPSSWLRSCKHFERYYWCLRGIDSGQN